MDIRIFLSKIIDFLGVRQIFSLNARLAAAESMTHDVIRDLLGVKLDMTTCMVLYATFFVIY